MIIIAGSSHVKLAQQLATRLKAEIVIANTKKFEDQELKIQITHDLYNKDIIILQSTSKPANDHLMELLLLTDTAKRAGARNITAIVPYFGYSRQDRPSYAYGPISASLVANLIETSGINRLITIDLHSKQAEGFFKIGVKNLDSSSLFIPLFDNQGKYVVVSPDLGGLTRAKIFAHKLQADLVIIDKSRNFNGECEMTSIIGDAKGKDCIIIDDIVDTGSTICKASRLLKDKGAKSVAACITHGVFSGDCLKKIGLAEFDNFYISDTISNSHLPNFINVIPSVDLIANAINKEVINV